MRVCKVFQAEHKLTWMFCFEVVGDHTRAITYLISDGVLPSNVGRGYVVRRLVRRTVMKGRILGIKDLFTAKLADAAIKMSEDCDPAVKKNKERICSVLTQVSVFSNCHRSVKGPITGTKDSPFVLHLTQNVQQMSIVQCQGWESFSCFLHTCRGENLLEITGGVNTLYIVHKCYGTQAVHKFI